MSYEYELKIGLTSATVVYLESIITHMCQPEFIRWPRSYVGGGGASVGDGLPVAVWRFDSITQADVNTLRDYWVVDDVYVLARAMAIKTRMDDGTYETFDCMGHWDREMSSKRQVGGMYKNLELKFTALVLAS